MARRSNRTTRVSRRERRATTVVREDETQDLGPWLTYGGPWGATVGGWVATEVTHALVVNNPTGMAFTALALAGTGAALGKLVSHLDAGAKRDKDVRTLHTVNVAAMTAGVTLGTVVGVDNAATAGAWFLAGTALSAGNNLWSKLHKKAPGEKAGGKWAKLEDEIGLAKHELLEANSNGKGTVLAKVEAKDGATAEELARKIPSLASVLKIGKGRITHTVDDDDSSLMTMRIQVADLLKEGFGWRGPSAFGASFGDTPIRIGRYEDGEDLVLNLPGQLRDPGPLGNGNVEHAIAMGVNGAGKTQGNQLIVTECATRTEVSVIVLDCSKFDQDFGAVRHGITWPIKDGGTARRFFKIMPKAIEARTEYLAAKGLTKWVPGCGLNFVVVIGEEAADFAADNEHYQKILRTARAAGFWILTSLQRATHNNMDTDSRANSPAGLCYGLRDGSDAQYCLPDEAIEAGAWPQWGNRKPGYLYAAGLGIPEDRWHVTARTEFADRAELAAAITAAAGVRTPLDAVTAKAFGELFANRTTYDTPLLEEGTAPAAPASVPAPAAAPDDGVYLEKETEPVEIEVDEEALAREVEDLMDGITELLQNEPERGEYDHLRLEDPIPAPEEDQPTLELTRDEAEGGLSTDDAQTAIYEQLDAWIRQGRPHFRPTELSDIWSTVALKDPRRWFYRVLNKLKADGYVSDDDGGQGDWDILRSPIADENGNGE